MSKKQKDLKSMVDEQLKAMLESDAEPSEGRMKLIGISIKKLALDAKLEENEYGGFFSTDAESGHTDRPTKRKNREEPASGGGEAGATEH
jgi:hypothetical protein